MITHYDMREIYQTCVSKNCATGATLENKLKGFHSK